MTFPIAIALWIIAALVVVPSLAWLTAAIDRRDGPTSRRG